MAKLHAHIREEVQPDRVAALLRSQGYRYASAIAAGALINKVDAVSLARRAGLIEPVDTQPGRAAGLLK